MPDDLIRYPPIADHGMVGDLQTAALFTAQGVFPQSFTHVPLILAWRRRWTPDWTRPMTTREERRRAGPGSSGPE